MPEVRHILVAPAGFRSREAGLFVAQMDDQNRRLTENTRGLSPAELEWQPAPGMNTIGMLLAHIAVVEVWWILNATVGQDRSDVRPALGIGGDDDGMPLAEGGRPPESLRGKPLEFFDDLLSRARAHTQKAVEGLDDLDLDREVRVATRDAKGRVLNVRWILYHVLEHEAGHYGQINLLRHQLRLVAGAAGRSAG